MPRNDRKTVLDRQDKVLRLRLRRVPNWRIAQALDISPGQAYKDYVQARERQQEETAPKDWLLEQEAHYAEIARTAWEEHDRLTQASRTDPDANIRASSSRIGALRLAMAAQDRIAELHGIRLGRDRKGHAPWQGPEDPTGYREVPDRDIAFEAQHLEEEDTPGRETSGPVAPAERRCPNAPHRMAPATVDASEAAAGSSGTCAPANKICRQASKGDAEPKNGRRDPSLAQSSVPFRR
jgi:hypothetical protein